MNFDPADIAAACAAHGAALTINCHFYNDTEGATRQSLGKEREGGMSRKRKRAPQGGSSQEKMSHHKVSNWGLLLNMARVLAFPLNSKLVEEWKAQKCITGMAATSQLRMKLLGAVNTDPAHKSAIDKLAGRALRHSMDKSGPERASGPGHLISSDKKHITEEWLRAQCEEPSISDLLDAMSAVLSLEAIPPRKA